jgi:ApaG protein
MNKYAIAIAVKTQYIDRQSEPENDRYWFSYTIDISNTGSLPAKLLSRYWLITDANGKAQEVRGEGVVGEQPYLRPGEHFEYTSSTVLETPVGSMEGRYQMVADDGEPFHASIPLFCLAKPHALH